MLEAFDTVSGAEQGAWVHLRNMTTNTPAYLDGEDGKEDKSKPCRIRIMGQDSPSLKAKMRTRAAALLKARGGKMDLMEMSDEQILKLIDDAEDKGFEDLADATLGWENLTLKGEPVKFSRDKALWLYETYPAIARQVQKKFEDEGTFTKAA